MLSELSTDLQKILIDTLLITAQLLLIWIGQQLLAWVKHHISQRQFNLIAQIADLAVQSVEQTLAGKADSQEKFWEAVRTAEEVAVRHGITLTSDQWQAPIEAAVRSMNQWGLPPQTTPEPVAAPLPPVTPPAPESTGGQR